MTQKHFTKNFCSSFNDLHCRRCVSITCFSADVRPTIIINSLPNHSFIIVSSSIQKMTNAMNRLLLPSFDLDGQWRKVFDRASSDQSMKNYLSLVVSILSTIVVFSSMSDRVTRQYKDSKSMLVAVVGYTEL